MLWLRQYQAGIFVSIKQCYYCEKTGTFPKIFVVWTILPSPPILPILLGLNIIQGLRNSGYGLFLLARQPHLPGQRSWQQGHCYYLSLSFISFFFFSFCLSLSVLHALSISLFLSLWKLLLFCLTLYILSLDIFHFSFCLSLSVLHALSVSLFLSLRTLLFFCLSFSFSLFLFLCLFVRLLSPLCLSPALLLILSICFFFYQFSLNVRDIL